MQPQHGRCVAERIANLQPMTKNASLTLDKLKAAVILFTDFSKHTDLHFRLMSKELSESLTPEGSKYLKLNLKMPPAAGCQVVRHWSTVPVVTTVPRRSLCTYNKRAETICICADTKDIDCHMRGHMHLVLAVLHTLS